MKTMIMSDFQICIIVPLNEQKLAYLHYRYL